MVLNNDFKFLNVQVRHTKPNKDGEIKRFYVINLLDEENNPCKFYSFDENNNTYIENSINSNKVKPLQDVKVNYELTFTNNNWNVKMNSLEF